MLWFYNAVTQNTAPLCGSHCKLAEMKIIIFNSDGPTPLSHALKLFIMVPAVHADAAPSSFSKLVTILYFGLMLKRILPKYTHQQWRRRCRVWIISCRIRLTEQWKITEVHIFIEICLWTSTSFHKRGSVFTSLMLIEACCSNTVKVDKQYFPEVKLFIGRCRPYYHHRHCCLYSPILKFWINFELLPECIFEITVCAALYFF